MRHITTGYCRGAVVPVLIVHGPQTGLSGRTSGYNIRRLRAARRRPGRCRRALEAGSAFPHVSRTARPLSAAAGPVAAGRGSGSGSGSGSGRVAAGAGNDSGRVCGSWQDLWQLAGAGAVAAAVEDSGSGSQQSYGLAAARPAGHGSGNCDGPGHGLHC